MYYDEEEPYYEPNAYEEIVMEYQQKMREILLDTIKVEMKNTKEDNIRLKAENQKLKDEKRQVDQKERDLKYKEENLKREVEREFYKSNIGDNLKDYIEKAEVWFADSKGFEQEKCSLCNSNRKLVAKFKNKKTTEINCDCSKLVYRYVPELAELTVIRFSKRDSEYQSKRDFYISNTYSPSKKSSYYDDHSYNEFKLCQIVDEFNDSTKELHEDKKYDTKIAFKTQEECQKYCDWLNIKNLKSADEDDLDEDDED